MNIINPFNVGDRVEATRKIGRIKCGEIGTVCAEELDVGMYVRVRWDRHVGGHDCGGHCEEGYGFNVAPEYLTLVSQTAYEQYTNDDIMTLLGGAQ